MKKATILLNSRGFRFILGLVAITLTASIMFANRPKDCLGGFREDLTILAGSYSMITERADTAESRQKGLSGRICIPERTGMLFVFEKPDLYGIWMKDMNFPIDVIWLDATKKVVHIEKNLLPGTYPTVFYPKDPALYVLETKNGLAAKAEIHIGQQLSW